MRELIADIKAGKITMLFCYDLSRISRDVLDTNIFIKLLRKYNVTLKCLYKDVKTETASDRFNTNIETAQNQYERERTSERTNDCLISIAESGRYPLGGRVLFGYKRGKDKDIYLHERYSIIVKNVFEMAKERYTLDDIREYVNAAQKKRKFSNTDIKDMMHNQMYAGILNYKGRVYKNIVPPIVSLDDLEAAQEYYKIYLIKQNDKYLFDDIMFCSIHNRKMSCTCSYNNQKKIYFYYYCNRCKATVSQNSIENYIQEIGMKSSKKENKEKIKEIDKKRYSLRRRIKSLQKSYIDKKYTPREFSSLVIPLEDRLEQLDIKRESIKIITRKTINYSDITDNMEKKKFLLSTVKGIYVNPIKKEVTNVDLYD